MKNIKSFLIVALLILTIMIPSISIADFGDFESYDSGWGGSSSSWDYDYDYDYGGNYSYSSSDDIGLIELIVIVVIIVIAVKYGINGNKTNTQNGVRRNYGSANNSRYIRSEARSHAVAASIKQIDPQFNEDKFISEAKDLYIRLQHAWMNRDMEELRPLISEAMYEQYSHGIQGYISRKQINKLERISTNFGELVSFSQDNEKDTLTVAINSSMIDYIISEETNQILKGDMNTRVTNTYKLVYTRKKGVLTEAGTDELNTTNCPNCGAPTNVLSSGRCEYCNSIITTGSHNWVLTNIERF